MLIRKLFGLVLIALAALSGVTTVLAATGINVIPVLVVNGTSSIARAVALPFNLSSQGLVNGAWMAPNGLDTDVLTGGVSNAYMPGTGRVRMLGCFNNAATNETAACNNVTTSDMTLPATGSQVYEFAAENQFSHLWINTSIPAVATWKITWEYYNGSSYVALSGVTDGTSNFTESGLKQITWSFPAANLWPESTLHAVKGYFVRARISGLTSVSVSPVATQAWYETGRWWTFSPSIGANQQQRFDLELGTGVVRPHVNYFPHPNGVTLADTGDLELGNKNWTLQVEGYIDTSGGTDKRIIYKSGSIEVTIPATGALQVRLYQ